MIAISNQSSETAILREIGHRLRRHRLNRNLTQGALAERTGLARRTIAKAEQGEVTTVATLVAILRGLELLGQLDQFLPEPLISPVQLAKLQGHPRQRASRKSSPSKAAKRAWKWND